MTDIELSTVYEAMKAHDAEPGGDGADRRKMAEALRAAGLMRSGQPALTDVALSAWRNARMSGSLEQAMAAALAAVTDLITPKPTRAEVPFSQVHQAVAAYVAEGHGDGVYENDHRLSTAMRERLRVDFRSSGPAGALGHYDSRAQDRFFRQVKTALDKLADAGVLRKAGAGSTGPDGRPVDRTSVRYYTPEAWDAAVARARDEQAGRAQLRARWEAVNSRLAALGIHTTRDDHEPARISLESWGRLLSLVDGGGGLPTHVRFAHPDAGYQGSRDQARRLGLVPGRVYVLTEYHVGRSDSAVELLETGTNRINAVMFEPASHGSWEGQEP